MYKESCFNKPPVIDTVNSIQLGITKTEIEEDALSRYSNEFLYYWGMICLGEQSHFIYRNLSTSKACFSKIKSEVHKARSRLAYIRLLETKEPNNEAKNVKCIETLRKWAGKGDVFSRIALTKISYGMSSKIDSVDEPAISNHVQALIKPPCQVGHPVAIRFFNSVIEDAVNSGDGKSYKSFIPKYLDECNIDTNALYDF